MKKKQIPAGSYDATGLLAYQKGLEHGIKQENKRIVDLVRFYANDPMLDCYAGYDKKMTIKRIADRIEKE